MSGFLVKVFSFFIKEFHDIRRQPMLLVSLVGGPLLVLGAFGATFKSANPFISTVLVWPQNGVPGISQEQAAKFIGSNFYLSKITTDKDEAMQMLENGQVDVVQVIPELSLDPTGEKVRPEIQVFSKTVDPNVEAWVRSLSYGEMNYINQQLLAQEARTAQEKAKEITGELEAAQTEFQQISTDVNLENLQQVEKTIVELRPLLAGLLAVLPPESFAQANFSPELSKLRNDVQTLADDLDELEKSLLSGEAEIQIERLNSASEEIENLRGSISVFVETPSENIISPVRETYENLRGSVYPLVVFYAPSVLALLVQQLAVTLAALGLVRERQMGSFEMFRVSPLRLSQILLGKALAYILFVTIAGVILIGLLKVLGVPYPSNVAQTLWLLILLATASVGVGYLISATSRTDSQAIQMTMLFLLLSIFFTGFFLPMSGFSWPAWIISALIPMTTAIEGFQELMLSGTNLAAGSMMRLYLIIFLSYGLVALIMRRQYRKVLD
jgi:ABC-2 type transport system permease protein